MDRLIVFLKDPQPGCVKTRLARAIGVAAAAAAYRELVDILLGGLISLPNVELRFTPDEASPVIQAWLRPSWQARPQGGGDLGHRLQSAFAEAFAEGANRVVIIGSDCPAVTAIDIRAAWDQLATHDLVLGPATDGGYWLVGLNRPQPWLFDHMPWSTETVFAETVRRAEMKNLSVQRLRELADVDTEEDWVAFLKRADRR